MASNEALSTLVTPLSGQTRKEVMNLNYGEYTNLVELALYGRKYVEHMEQVHKESPWLGKLPTREEIVLQMDLLLRKGPEAID